MSWNYRVMVRDGEHAIHEVIYDDDGRITGYTAEPVFPAGESAEAFAAEFALYSLAPLRPVLDYAEVEAESEARRRGTAADSPGQQSRSASS
ncbi:hypothetical protein [Zavarzinella formosa]|uniref:hypothetical protein n=1 Tax=Zavarzinella formosa TaxID=360055 RepID=UPI0012F92C18|nr:hypothetical protein [Zavarzinella formosa]